MTLRALVVYKRSVLELVGGTMEGSALDELLARNPNMSERYKLADRENRDSVALVREALKARGIIVEELMRPAVDTVKGFDVVISVGGDGTFLDVAQGVEKIPILGVNSSISSSVGHYCTTDARGLGALLDDLLAEQLPLELCPRIQVEIDGRALEPPALNDVLFSHPVPAGTTRYVLEAAGQSERQKSSGIWICTATGSTGATRSAGGLPMAKGSAALQFLVREPYQHVDIQRELFNGIQTEPLCIRNLAREARVYLDGPRTWHPVTMGQRVRLIPGVRPLAIYRSRTEP